ncbi:MAG: hypothetical protein EOP89_08250, partial [Lysobacteraceae bacterium]
MTGTPLTLYNSLTRALETFTPIDPHVVRIYTCGPTVYNYQHIGNMRAFLFADTLGRVIRWKGWPTKHVINITDVGHLTSDADAGDDKMEKAAAAQAKSIWEIAAHYTTAFKEDVARLNIEPPAEWTVATDHIPEMIHFAQNQAFCGCEDSGARIWMHNNFLVDRGGKMSKSTGQFLRLQTLVDAGF